MKTSVMKISPNLAREMLKGNVENRTIRQSHVQALADAILDGRWQVTHQGVCFSDDPTLKPWGRLLDGQHRLEAIIKAGKFVEMMVTTGADQNTYKVMDINKVRAHFDRIHLVDDPKQNQLLCIAINAYLRHAVSGRGTTPVDDIETEFLTRTDSWLWAAKTFKGPNRGLNVSAVTAAMAIYHSDSPAKATAFAASFLDGTGLSDGSPILLLREGLLSKRIDTKNAEAYWKTVAACRAHRDNRKLSNLLSATQDFLGNEFSTLKHERLRSHVGPKNKKADDPIKFSKKIREG